MLKWGKYLLVVLALAGVVSMGYLVSLYFSPDEGAFCNLGEGLSCDIVNKSEYATILGIPMSVLGLLYFLGVLALVLWKYDRNALRIITFGTIAFLGPSLYLSYIEYFVINNVCVFCEFSKLLMLGIVAVAWVSLRPAKLGKNLLLWSIILAIVFGGATYLIQANTGPADLYNEFAQCLDEKGFKMYGSITCAFCARQRAMFGDAFEFIKELECDPRNRGPQEEVELCIAKDIEGTPTWMQEDDKGNELYRFGAGVQSLKTLSEVSGCPLPEKL